MTDPAGATDPKGVHTPNHVPAGERLWHGLLSLALLAYAGWGLWHDDLFIPAKRGPGLHLHGFAAWTMALAMVCACANLMSVIVDHYDRRNNETDYKAIARLTAIAGWCLFGLAVVLGLGQGR